MKKLLVLALLLSLVGCGKGITKNGKFYDCYGIVDKTETRSTEVNYELQIDSVIWSVVGVETIILPLLLLGFKTHCPVGLK